MTAKLRVRTGSSYPVKFSVDLGQRNAVLIKRPLTPLRRLAPWMDAFAPVPEPGYDLVHSLNAVPLLTRRPYVITFEDYLPRVPEDRYIGWLEARLRVRLLRDQCVRLIAMSRYAQRQFRRQNRAFDGRGKLEEKMELIYPGVPLRREGPKKRSGALRLLFVGADFMRKGGPAVLRAHAELTAKGIPVQTTVVSSLRWSAGDYVGPADEGLVRREYARLGQDGVVHHGALSNAAVKELMDGVDFLVLPTVHDTFGFACVEALAGGTPVVATSTCALPEIVEDGRSGFLLPLDNDPEVGKWRWIYRNGDPGYADQYQRANAGLSAAIVERLGGFYESPDGYEQMSAAALDRARTRFDPIYARDRLEQLYASCFPNKRKSGLS